jgi:NADH:ubiquinone oxidoreductase subunit 6 (subunit J)
LILANLGLFVVALSMVACATCVITSRNLVHSVFWLAGMLLSTAVLFIALEAPFLAGIQVLLYTGGVITMMLFGVMLTLRQAGNYIPNLSEHAPGRAAVAGLFGVTLLSAIWTTPELAAMAPSASGSAGDIGQLFLGRYLIAFEALSMLLLAGMIGAIVLARKGDA